MADAKKELLKPKIKITPERKLYFSLFHPCSRRFHVLLLIMIGYFSLVYMRTNLGLAMTCMVNSTVQVLKADVDDPEVLHDHVQTSQGCQAGNVKASDGHSIAVVNDYGGTLEWDSSVQAWLFSATFYGNIISGIPAGILADRYSPKMLLFWCAVVTVLCTLSLPYLALNFGFQAVFVSRFLMGLAEGFLLPSINKMISKWIPTDELSTAASIYTTGNQMAGGIGAPLAAALCGSAFKWPSVFYVCALIGIVWMVIWAFTVSDNPADCKLMHKKEKQYLISKLSQERSNTIKGKNVTPALPYWEMLTSLPLWSLLICTFTSNMIVVLIQAYLPMFFKEVLFLGMMSNGIFNALPNVSQLIVKFIWSLSMDNLKKSKLSSTAACKISQAFSSTSVGVIFITLAVVADCSRPYIALFLLCCMTMCFSTAISGFYTSLLSLAPLYTGTLTSISMVSGNLGRLVTPLVISWFNQTGSMSEWRKVFYFMATSTFLSGMLFLFFGSGSAQEWGKAREEPSPNNDETRALQQRRRQRLESHVGSVVLDMLD